MDSSIGQYFILLIGLVYFAFEWVSNHLGLLGSIALTWVGLRYLHIVDDLKRTVDDLKRTVEGLEHEVSDLSQRVDDLEYGLEIE